ncbi:transposase [Nonomuraea sp. H19]|uniref:transposase n=1 Tax=Nonomuraea sp. H19 TaxID=3452206 RepID=UPI003F8B37A9
MRRGRRVAYNLHAPLVFTPKYRRKMFSDEILRRCYLWGGHFWSPSYLAASCGGAPLSIIKEYIEYQKRPE